jgi:uncharacterized protein (TIGR03435 family)
MRASRNTSAVLLLLAGGGAFGQRFDVASVKVSDARGPEGKAHRGIKSSPGSVTIQNLPLSAIVQWAYGVRDYQVEGPRWTDVDPYDIFAKAAGPAQERELQKMMQTLMGERFKLVTRREVREFPIYSMTIAIGGHKLKPPEGEGPGKLVKGEKFALRGERVSMAELAGQLSQPLRRPVIDRTGLAGTFNFTIDRMSYVLLDASGKPSPESTTEMDRDGIVIMAVQQQLGLKLEPGKAPVEMIVIEKAEKIPTDN